MGPARYVSRSYDGKDMFEKSLRKNMQLGIVKNGTQWRSVRWERS